MMKIEIRSGTEALIEGYVNAVGRDSRVMRTLSGKKFVEQVTPGTFSKALKRGENIEVRFNHGKRLGDTSGGSLNLFEDSIGLYAKALIHDEEVIKKAKDHELRGWSFGFVKRADEWEDADEGLSRRKLSDIELREVSILDKTPAYIATSIEMRGEEGEMLERRAGDEEPEISVKDEKRGFSNEIYAKKIKILEMEAEK